MGSLTVDAKFLSGPFDNDDKFLSISRFPVFWVYGKGLKQIAMPKSTSVIVMECNLSTQKVKVASTLVARYFVTHNKVRELDIRGIVHYEFVPTGQSTKFTIWEY